MNRKLDELLARVPEEGEGADCEFDDVDLVYVKCEVDDQSGEHNPEQISHQLKVQKGSVSQEDKDKFAESAKLAIQGCLADMGNLAVPDEWLIRPEHHRPQLVIAFAEKDEDGKYKSPKYAITIPHYKGGKPESAPLPAYEKGSYEGILVLSDNSKVTVNAKSEAEAQKMLDAAKALITGDMLSNSYSKIGKIKADFKQIKVYPYYAVYYPEGRKSERPEWRKKFV